MKTARRFMLPAGILVVGALIVAFSFFNIVSGDDSESAKKPSYVVWYVFGEDMLYVDGEGNQIGFNSWDRPYSVNVPKLTTNIATVINDRDAEGYDLVSITPLAKGSKGMSSSTNYSSYAYGAGAGYGYTFAVVITFKKR